MYVYLCERDRETRRELQVATNAIKKKKLEMSM